LNARKIPTKLMNAADAKSRAVDYRRSVSKITSYKK